MTSRQCFPCTACCEGWLKAEIRGVKLKPWKACEFSVNKCCGIYEDRPEIPCRSFKCAWLQEKHQLPEHMKPSESGAIVLLDRKWHGGEVIMAVPTGKKIPAETLEWLMAYAREQSLPLLFHEFLFKDGKMTGRKHIGYGPPSFVRAVEKEVGYEDVVMF